MPFKSHRNANAAPPRSSRKDAHTAGTEEVIGRLTALDPINDRIEVEDERSSRRLWFDLSGARLRNLEDSDGDGRRSITDLFPGDRVKVLADKGAESMRRARSLRRVGPQGPVGGLRRLAG